MKSLVKIALYFSLLLCVSQLTSAQTSRCIPGLGGQFFTSGGIVQVEILKPDADFKSEIDLFTPKPLTEIGFNQETGKVVAIGAFPQGSELVFGILVYNTGLTFRMGPGSRNPDGAPHAIVQCISDGVANVGFEDKVNSDSLDYNDAVIQIRASPIKARSGSRIILVPGGVAKFFANETNNPPPGAFGFFFYLWAGVVKVDYDYYYDSARGGFVVFIKRVDQSVVMPSANNANHPCDITLRVSTDVYENDGQNYVGTIRVAQPGSYIYPQNALSYGGISYPRILVFKPKLTVNGAALSTDCGGGGAFSHSYGLPL